MKRAFWAILAISFGALFTSFVFSYSPYKNTEVARSGNGTAAVIGGTTQKESYFYFSKNLAQKPKLSATAYIVGDLQTGEILLSKNEDLKLPIASVSKLMTALVANETLGKEKLAVVSKKALATEGGNGGLKLGEKIKTGDLLYPLLLESSNDAAEVLAETLGRNAFIQKMNEFAGELKMLKTSFADPSGLSPLNTSSVSDLFKLSKFLSAEKEDLVKITTNRSYTIPKHIWASNNQFLKKDGYLGGKSGYTDPARQTVISLFSLNISKDNPREVGIALLGSRDRRGDVEKILNYLKKNIYYGTQTDANAGWVKQKEGQAVSIVVKDPEFVTLSFAGDIMLARGVRNSVVKNFAGDYSALFDKLALLKKSDIVFANLEGPASDKGSDLGNLYSFRMDPSTLPALKGAGVSVLSLANNHIGDWGRAAFTDTLSRLKENEILYTGGGNTLAEAEKPAIIEKYGMKIGFLGFSDKGPAFMAANADNGGILLASNPRFAEIVKNAASQVDHLIVSFHFGEEYELKHNLRQAELAHKAIDNGAKIVIGHHPHVMQDFEIYKNGYIAYSLGNFIFDQGFSANTMQGMLLGVKLYKDGSMIVQKNIVKLNSAFKPDAVLLGKEEKLKFEAFKPITSQ